MARKTQPHEEWISGAEAAQLLTDKTDHTVSADYVRVLGNTGKVETKRIDGRTKVYLRADIEAYTVKKRGDGSIRVAAGHPRRIRTEQVEQKREEAIA